VIKYEIAITLQQCTFSGATRDAAFYLANPTGISGWSGLPWSESVLPCQPVAKTLG